MLSIEEAKNITQRNYFRIKELIRISYTLGVNLTKPTAFKEALRFWNICLCITSTISLYAHYSQVVRYIDDISNMTEAIYTGFQITLAIIKMIFYLFTQRKFAEILLLVESHAFLQQIELFQKDFPANAKAKLRTEIDAIMEKSWKSIRFQLLFFTASCTVILSWCILYCAIVNTYHMVKQTPNYQFLLTFPVVYPIWEHKGMTFPYYYIQQYLTGAAGYIAAMCAVSFDTLFVVLTNHCIALLEISNLLFASATMPLVPQEQRIEFLRCGFYHFQRTLSYYTKINAMYQHISLPQFLLSLGCVAICLFQISVSLEDADYAYVPRLLLYFLAAGSQIFIYCYNGQRVTTASAATTTALYSCAWYNESLEFQRLIRMMMIRSNLVCEMKMSLFTTMSMATLMLLFNKSGSYFLLLRNLSQ